MSTDPMFDSQYVPADSMRPAGRSESNEIEQEKQLGETIAQGMTIYGQGKPTRKTIRAHVTHD